MSKEQQLPETTGWASPFLEPAQTIRPLPGALERARIPTGRGQRPDCRGRRAPPMPFRELHVGPDEPSWGIVAKPPTGSVRMRLRGWALHMGGERMVVHLYHRGRARRIAALAADMSRPDFGAVRDPASGVTRGSFAGYRARGRPPSWPASACSPRTPRQHSLPAGCSPGCAT